MATKKEKKGSPNKLDVTAVQTNLLKQFEGLDPNDPGQWPLIPRIFVYIAAVAIVVGLAWFLVLSDKYESLDSAKRQEFSLRAEYRDKLAVAVNLGELKKQLATVQGYVKVLENQLPDKANMDLLLTEINAAGLKNSLEFEHLHADAIIVQEYYAEQPISIAVTGRSYDDFAKFAQDLAKIDRIVTLSNITLEPIDTNSGEASGLKMVGTLKTYRYMTEEDQARNRQAGGRR